LVISTYVILHVQDVLSPTDISYQDGSKQNKHYYYTRGWNLQALFAYIVGIALPFPGFVGTLGPSVSSSAANLGHLGWLLSFVSSFVVYYLVCLVFPTQNQRRVKELGLGWEEMAGRKLLAEDGTVISEGMEGHRDHRMGDEKIGVEVGEGQDLGW
jgi:NCS1 family nucleobase:cation symporter-1